MKVFLAVGLLGLSGLAMAQTTTDLSSFDPQERFPGRPVAWILVWATASFAALG